MMKKMKTSVTVSPSTSAARRGFFLLITACLLFAGSSVYAEPNLYNNEDFAGFAEEWQQSCTSGNGWCNGYDYDISGTVDIKDLSRFARLWLTSKDPVRSDDIAKWIVEVTHDQWTYKWNYDRGFLLLSLYEKWLAKPNPLYLEYIKNWVDAIIQPDGSIKPPGNETYYKISNYTLDHIQPGNLLLYLYELFGEARYKLAMDNNLIVQLTGTHTTFDGGFWHKQVIPRQMWLDGLYMAEPFACGYAKMFGDPNWYDVAGYQCTLMGEHSQDTLIYPGDPNRTGLCYHAWDSSKWETPPKTSQPWADSVKGHAPEFWGRGIGWYAMALVDCLDLMPADHSDRPQMLAILSTLAQALAYYQDPNDGPDPNNGMWWQVVNKGYPRTTYSQNYTETSCTAMFSYALARAVEKGYLPADPYLAVSRVAFESMVRYKLTYVGGYINLKDTVEVGGPGSYASYFYAAKKINDIKGVAAFMRAALQYEKMTP
jgi:unsaturated rhamnogalacturonyl hydrolase